MENLRITARDNTPDVNFDGQANHLQMSGESYPENVMGFFEPVLTWVKDYLQSGQEREIRVDIELVMFNSSTSKLLLDLLDLLNEAANNEKSITLNWRYEEDNDIMESWAEDLQEDFEHLKVNLVVLS